MLRSYSHLSILMFNQYWIGEWLQVIICYKYAIPNGIGEYSDSIGFTNMQFLTELVRIVYFVIHFAIAMR